MRKTLNLPITLFQGADFSVIIEVPGPSGPIDLTGSSFVGSLKSSTDPNQAVAASFTFTILDQITNKGQVTWAMDAATIDTLTASIAFAENPCRASTPYLYDVIMTDAGGQKTRIIQGTAYLSPQVEV